MENKIKYFNSFGYDDIAISNMIIRTLLEREEFKIIELPINEGIVSDLKTALKKIQKTAKDTTKVAIDKVLTWTDSAKDIVQNIINYIKEKVTVLFNKVGNLKQELIKNENFKNTVKKTNITDLREEINQLKDVISFYSTRFIDKLLTKIAEILSKNIVDVSESLNLISENYEYGDKVTISGETYKVIKQLGRRGVVVEDKTGKAKYVNIKEIKSVKLNEGFLPQSIEKVIHKIEHLPPFNWLHNIKMGAEKGINYGVEQLSNLTKSLGGPEFEIPVTSALLAIAIEYNIKGLTKAGILMTGVGSIFPPIAITVYGVAYIATFLAAYGAINTIIGEDK